MKKIFFLGALTSILFFSCSDDDDTTPLVVDFQVKVTGESPNAELAITNNSTGTSAYTWALGDGQATLLLQLKPQVQLKLIKLVI